MSMTAAPCKVIIDTDPGIDDAMAIFYALAHPAIHVLGLTTVFGNVSVQQATQNALLLLNMAEYSAPVVAGADKPLRRPLLAYPDFVHGRDGLGNQFLDITPTTHTINNTTVSPTRGLDESHNKTSTHAAKFIISQVLNQPGEITLVAIGPLTNLATALRLEPLIAQQVKQVIWMGGTLAFTGNVSPVAEANSFADPHAADAVMAATWPVVMVGLDVTSQVLMTRALFADIARQISGGKAPVGAFLEKAASFYIDFYQSEQNIAGCHGHDLAAVAYAVQPQWFGTVPGAICVATEGVAMGQTIMKRQPRAAYFLDDWDQRPAKKACMEVDSVALLADFHKQMSGGFWQ